MTYEGDEPGTGGFHHGAGLVAFAEPQGFLSGSDLYAVGGVPNSAVERIAIHPPTAEP